MARHRRATGKEPLPGLSEADAGATGLRAMAAVAATGTAVTAEDAAPAQQHLQVSAKVGCLCVGLYTQQQYLAVLLRVYDARVYLKKKKQDTRMKTKVGEFFVEHSNVRGMQRRSIVLCKKMVHIGAQCRRFPPASSTAAPSSPVSAVGETNAAALLRSEVRQWSGGRQPTSGDVLPPSGRRESSGASQLQLPGARADPRYASYSPGPCRGQNRDRRIRNRSNGGSRGTKGSSGGPVVPGSSDEGQRLQHSAGRWKRRDGEAAPRSAAFIYEEQVHGAETATAQDGASSPQQHSEEHERAPDADTSGGAAEALKLQPEAPFLSSKGKDKDRSSRRVTLSHGIQGRPRWGVLPGHLASTEEAIRQQEKHRISEFLRQARSRTGGAVQHLHQNQYRVRPWHWRAGTAEDGRAEDVINAFQGSSQSESSFDETERPYAGSGIGGANGTWFPDVVGGWTLRDETDGDECDATATPQRQVGHECCFGVPGAPLNLLLFDDNRFKKRMGSRRKQRTESDAERPTAPGKGVGSRRRDQLALNLRLQPESKTTEARLSLQSVHAFPTANLLCCLTDAALCLKSLWDEESIRSRCLCACLLGDVRSQKAARWAGLNLQLPVEAEAKRPVKRHFSLNRRMQQQHRADKYSSRGSGGSSDTSSCSSDSIPPGGLLRGKTQLRKQAKTTFSRWGPPEGFSDGDTSFPAGTAAGDASRRYSRSLSGGRRRKRAFTSSPSKDKTRSLESSARGKPAGASRTPLTSGEAFKQLGGVSGEGPSDTMNAPNSLQQEPYHTVSSPDASIKKAAATEGRGAPPPRGVSVFIELVLEDVTCNLLTDDAVGPQVAKTLMHAEEESTDGVAAGVPGNAGEYGRGGMHPTYVTSQQQQEQQLLRRRRHRQVRLHSSSSSSTSRSSSNRDVNSTVSTASTDDGAGGDAGLAFPPFPVLFSPDLCVPQDVAAQAGGLRLDSSLRRAVVADAAALGLRLEAVLRVTYTSVPTGSAPGKKREELKDTLRVRLWRLEATLIRNCTWALASAVLFDLNLRAECLRLLPPKKRRAATGTARGGGKSLPSLRAGTETERPARRSSQLQAVAEGDSEEEGDTAMALQRALWLAEGGDDYPPGESHHRGSQKWSSLSPWNQRGASNAWRDGYASAEGAVPPGGYGRKLKNSDGGFDEQRLGGDARRGFSGRAGSCTQAGPVRRRSSAYAPRRLPSSGSSSFFRWVFGSRGGSNPHLASAAESSPHDDAHVQQAAAHDWKRTRGPGVGDRRALVTHQKNYTDAETDHAASFTDAAAYGQQRPAEFGAGTSGTPPTRRLGSAVAWPRSLLRARRPLSTFNSADSGRAPSPPEGGRGTRRDYPFRSEVATASGDLSSPSARQAGLRGRLQLRPSGNVERTLPNRRGMRALSALPRCVNISAAIALSLPFPSSGLAFSLQIWRP